MTSIMKTKISAFRSKRKATEKKTQVKVKKAKKMPGMQLVWL